MKIAKNSVVTIDYTLTDDDGKVLDSSVGHGPMAYLHGHGQIVPGLEKALNGKGAGEQVKVAVAPKDGYGEKGGGKTMAIGREDLPGDVDLEEGMPLHATGPDGHDLVLWVQKIEGQQVTLSTEHPMAGVTLHFDVAIKEVRAATKDELQHGHAHGPEGHHHH